MPPPTAAERRPISSAMRRRVRRRAPQILQQLIRFRFHRAHALLRFLVQGQRQKLVSGGDQAGMVLRVGIQQVGAAGDLIQARLTIQRLDLFEHALVVAGSLHAVNHQLLAADRQAIHLHGGIHDCKQQRRGHDRKSDQHQSAQ